MDSIMDEFEIDYTGVEEAGTFKPIPVGDYDLVLDTADPQMSKSGDPQVVVDFRVDGGQFAGKKIRHWITFKPALLPGDPDPATGQMTYKPNPGAGIALRFLHVLGLEHEPGKLKIEPFKWVGKRVRAKVKIDTYQGKQNNKIQFFITDLDENSSPNGKRAEQVDEVPF